jgi:hypothetical protein
MTQAAPADAVIFVLLDAFRHDYLARTRFLNDIAPRSLVGQLEEPFGFCPRGAYFGGLTMAEQGYTNLFHYDPQRSVFRWTRDMAAGGANEAIGRTLRPEILRRARSQLPTFSAKPVNPWGIPLEWQNCFDVSEREAPWSRHVGYRSLFHQLDDAGRPWMEMSWPFLDLAGSPTDGVVAGTAIQRMNRDHQFAFMHLPALDALGHAFGPGAREVQEGIVDADRLCELICGRALELFRDPVILFAGDHGMVPVLRTVDAASALEATDLRFGHDFAFFIDSTMVRCWFFTEAARRITLAALAEIDGGHWVDADEKRRWQVDGIDARNGDAYFLADPGVVFSPNFFDWTGHHPPRGMHGYAPDAADNRALFLAHRPRQRAAGEVGVVHARRLYPTFLSWLGWNPRDFTALEPVSAPDDEARRSRWFVAADPAADALVESHLSRAVSAIRERAPATTAVVLAGGFGRGEGTPAGPGPAARPSNDYDVLVLGIDGPEVAGLGDELAREFNMDFVDVSGGRSLERCVAPRLSDFDLRYGSRVLWGDPATVERLGPLAPAELDIVEAAFLIGNRTGGMLLGLTGEQAAPGDERAYLARQTAKFLIAVADAWLIAIGDYSVSYAVRQRRFADLARAAGFRVETIDAVDRAYSAKLGTSAAGPCLTVPVPTILGALHDLERALGWHADPIAASDALVRAVRRHIQFATGDAVYRAVRDVFRAWPDGPAAHGKAARAALAGSFENASRIADADAARLVARLWLGFFH